MNVWGLIFWPLAWLLDRWERATWERECARWDELRGFTLAEAAARAEAEEVASWATSTKARQPAS